MKDYKGKWCIARVHIVFPKLKGCVKTKSGKRFISPGERFMPLKEELEFTYFGDMVERPFEIIEEGASK